MCPATLFEQTLILLFAMEPKQFLIEASDYLRPALFFEDQNNFDTDWHAEQEVKFWQLEHRSHYRIKFFSKNNLKSKTKKPIAYLSDDRMRSKQA